MALYGTLTPDDILIVRAQLLWAALQIDLGLDDDNVMRALAAAIASADPFWGYYHRIRLNLAREEYSSIGADVLAAPNYRA